MSLRTKLASYGFGLSAPFSACTLVLTCFVATAMAEQAPQKRAVNRPSQNTIFVECHDNEKPRRVLSSVALSEGEKWRAYVEVNVQRGCLQTTRLWVAKANHPYRLVYLVPPKRDAAGNGMEILGWARNSRMLLAKTEQWQYGSDTQRATGTRPGRRNR